MRLYLLRHGSAEERPPDGSDSPKRRLVSKGHRQCQALAKALDGMGVYFDRVLTSPYLRALETAQSLLKARGDETPIELEERLNAETTVEAIVEVVLEQRVGSLLLVGHEPTFSAAATRLMGVPELSLRLKKSGFIELELWRRDPPLAELRGLLRPGHIRFALS